MAQKTGKVIKNEKIENTGVKKISYNASGRSSGGVNPTAEIIGHEDGFAIIQVQCSCGQEIQLRCAQNDPA